jgi:hypothetical protein
MYASLFHDYSRRLTYQVIRLDGFLQAGLSLTDGHTPKAIAAEWGSTMMPRPRSHPSNYGLIWHSGLRVTTMAGAVTQHSAT